MTSDPRDQKPGMEFEQDLEAVRSAWSGLEQAEPPDLLDQAVLNKARMALESRSKWRPLRWLGGFATAAVVVLSLSIVIQQEPQVPVSTTEGTEGLRLDQATSAAAKKADDSDLAEEKSAKERTIGPGFSESDERLENRAKQSSPEPASAPAEPQEANLLRVRKAESEQMPAVSSADMGAGTAAVSEMLADAIPEAEKADTEAEAWIEKLLLLQETQQDEKLVMELAAFRKAYPDYPLPPALED